MTERVDEVAQAEEIAASVDRTTARAVEQRGEKTADSELAEDALEAAAMVAEGGPVDEPPMASGALDGESADVGSAERIDGPPVEPDEQGEARSPIPAESLAAAALRNDWQPMADPPEPGPGNPSPDGTTLAFLQPGHASETRLWFYALDGSSRRSMGLPFVPVIDRDGPQWSPDGKWLAMTGSEYAGGPTAIWLVPVDGGDCVLVARHNASDRQPRWSPDGSLLAFVSNRDGRSSICVALPTGDGPVIQLTWTESGQDDREPCWSDDSTRIAFLRRFSDGDWSGDHVWTVSIATGETKQATKKTARRHDLRWNPGKTQVGFITDEGEWLNVGVVNPDNSAGWNLASEAGDKDEPRYNADGSRLLYTRGLKGEVRLGERATSGASAELIDPGMGVASAPRWLPGKRVVYRFAPATGGSHFIVQDTKKDAERTILPAPIDWDAGRPLILPTF
ncbi:MAG: TolB family protein, partial [Thermomicrobiales bacterium]